MFDFWNRETDRVNAIIKQGAASKISEEKFILNEISQFISSKKRKDMLTGKRYFKGQHDVLEQGRTVIGETGLPEPVHNLPDNRIVDNQYRKMVNQKANYFLGQPITFKSDNPEYNRILNKVFSKGFQRTMRNIGEDSFNSGIGWLFIHYDDSGELRFRRMRSYEICPGWADDEHTVLDYAIRPYEVIVYDGDREKTVKKVEIYKKDGLYRYTIGAGALLPDEIPYEPYLTVNEQPYAWSKIPLIPFKYNQEEIPLINNVKSLQDGINKILSAFENNMEEDARNTILVLVNYDGENLGEFRQNLATYGAVKLASRDGVSGDLRTLQVEVKADNYKVILELFKKALIENAMGYDAKDDRVGGNANQLNIMSMYSDIDTDANGMETEYQASMEEVLWFVNNHLYNTGQGDWESEQVEVIFNRDILINETEAIDNCIKSTGILSDETIVANHPWVDNTQGELDRIKVQNDTGYSDAFGHNHGSGNDPPKAGEVDGKEE